MTTATAALAAGTWAADPVHSDVAFRVRHTGVGRVRGTFSLTSATLIVGDDGLPGRRISSFPTIEFASTGVRGLDGATFTLVGDLTIHGATRSVEPAAEWHGVVADGAGR